MRFPCSLYLSRKPDFWCVEAAFDLALGTGALARELGLDAETAQRVRDLSESIATKSRCAAARRNPPARLAALARAQSGAGPAYHRLP